MLCRESATTCLEMYLLKTSPMMFTDSLMHEIFGGDGRRDGKMLPQGERKRGGGGAALFKV